MRRNSQLAAATNEKEIVLLRTETHTIRVPREFARVIQNQVAPIVRVDVVTLRLELYDRAQFHVSVALQ